MISDKNKTIDRRRAVLGMAAIVTGTSMLGRRSYAAEPPIKIGFGVQLTGSLAAAGKAALLTAQIWAEEVNKAGGLLGRPVELVYYDDQSNPGLVPAIYSKLINIDNVDLLMAISTNQVAPAMPLIIQKKRIVMAMFALAVNEQFKYPRYFQMQPFGPNGKDAMSQGFFEAAATINPKPQTVAFVGADAEFAKSTLEGARAHAKNIGLRTVYDEVYPPNTVNFSPVLTALKASSPDIVFVASYPADTVGIIRTVQEIRLEAKMFGGTMIGLQYAAIKQQLGAALNGVVCFELYSPEPTVKFPGIDRLLQQYQGQAQEHGVDKLGFYNPPVTYAALQVLADAVTKTGDLDQKKLADYIHQNSFQTVMGNVRFGPDGEWAQPQLFTVQFKNIKGSDFQQFKEQGKEVILFPPQYKSGDLEYPFAARQG
ncbi:MAG: amino acid ABC transporter substrate-binding protein [Xanthobacteraceae bacterium]|nr:amino acid ABC transporter substrate-binding protein [Xanthobacteraceae bacterium]